MRTITLIVVHCSAVRPEQVSSAKDIDGKTGMGTTGRGSGITSSSDGTGPSRTDDPLRNKVPTAWDITNTRLVSATRAASTQQVKRRTLEHLNRNGHSVRNWRSCTRCFQRH